MSNVKLKKIRDVVRIHQHWKHMRTRENIYVAQVYRHERRVLAIRFEDGQHPQPSKSNYTYVNFIDLRDKYTLMGAFPNDTRQAS